MNKKLRRILLTFLPPIAVIAVFFAARNFFASVIPASSVPVFRKNRAYVPRLRQHARRAGTFDISPDFSIEIQYLNSYFTCFRSVIILAICNFSVDKACKTYTEKL